MLINLWIKVDSEMSPIKLHTLAKGTNQAAKFFT